MEGQEQVSDIISSRIRELQERLLGYNMREAELSVNYFDLEDEEEEEREYLKREIQYTKGEIEWIKRASRAIAMHYLLK